MVFTQQVAYGLVLPVAKSASGGQVPYLNIFFRNINSNTTAVFGQATYNFSEKISFTAGLSNTSDKKSCTAADLASVHFAPNTVKFFYPNAPTSATQTALNRQTVSVSLAEIKTAYRK